MDALVELLAPAAPEGLLKELCGTLFGGSAATGGGVLEGSGTLSTVAAVGAVGVEDRPAARVPPGDRANEAVAAGDEVGAIL